MNRARFALISAAAVIALFFAMLLCLELGRRAGMAQTERLGTTTRPGVGVVDGLVSAVLALLLGFVFSGAMSRFDHRRQLIVQQVTAISNAWLRLDCLPADAQPAVRDGFRRFVDALVAAYQHPAGSELSRSHAAAMSHAFEDVWSRSVVACLGPGGERSPAVVLPAITEMFAAVDRERLTRRIHPPAVIYVMLALASLASALLAGYTMAEMATQSWLLNAAVAGIACLVIYVIVQIEYPRLGLVRLDSFDRALVELRAAIGGP